METVGFVAGTTMASLADWDLYFAMLDLFCADSDDGLKLKDLGSNVQRWLEATQVSVQKAAAGCAKLVCLPNPIMFPTRKSLLPSFIYADLTPAASVVPVSAAETAGSGVKAVAAVALEQKKEVGSGGEITDEQKKAAADKRAKKAAEKAAKKAKQKASEPAPPVTELDVSALDIRVGKILKAWEHPEAEKLYCEEVDVGEEKPRQIASGLRPFYKLEDMQNQTVLVLCNLKARSLVGFPSHGMVMCASNDDHTKVEFAVPPEGAKIGERVVFDGFVGEPEVENKVAKKKIFEKIAPDLKTDDKGNVIYKGSFGKVGSEPCRAKLGMPNAHVA